MTEKPLRLISFEYFQWYGNRKLLKQSTFLYFLVNMQKGGGLVKMSADWSAKGESVQQECQLGAGGLKSIKCVSPDMWMCPWDQMWTKHD